MNKFWFSVLRQESFAEEDEKITDSVGIIFYNYGDDDRAGRLCSKCVSAIIYFAQCYYYVFFIFKEHNGINCRAQIRASTSPSR